jgi:hypothetical protein
MTYRSVIEPCAFCAIEQDTAELAPLAGLAACSRCRAGDLEAAIEAHGFEVEHERYHGKRSGTGWQAHVEVKRSNRPDLVAHLEAEPGFDNWFTRLFRKADPEIGVEDFDRQVRIEVEAEHEDALRVALGTPGAREAVVRLVGLGCGVSLNRALVSTGAAAYTEAGLPSLAEMTTYIVALAVHIDRAVARGELPEFV